ncbi:MAG: polyphenol oxidase family protein [Treponema sp.]|nr:polyphenol oxidase family protein [Treponema sp.]
MQQQKLNNLDSLFVEYSFVKNNQLLQDAPKCGMTIKAASSMRFRWDEKNPRRQQVLKEISADKTPLPIELIHSQIVYDLESLENSQGIKGDGIISKNKNLMPVLTVADCLPIYLYDSKNKVFGLVHSGWKGTGIIAKAIELAQKNYNSKAQDISIIIGPHIHDCCYIVDEERARYFAENFTPSCIRELEEGGKTFAGGRGLAIEWDNGQSKLYRLSLLKANLQLLENCGIPEENILIIDECTCCNEKLGSNRRETALASKALGRKLSPQEAGHNFTVQAAFIHW